MNVQKNSNFSLQIPEPCHENWAEMTPSEQGRFCQNCQKIVVDFSKMNDRDLTQWFAARAGERVCGRVNQRQLNRDFSYVTPLKSTFYQRTAILVSGLFFATSAYGQDYNPTEITTTGNTILVHPPKYAEPSKTEKTARILRGIVLDERGEPIPSAYVVIKETSISTSTDSKGIFKVVLSNKFDKTEQIQLEVQLLGYISVERTIKLKGQDSLDKIEIRLVEDTDMLLGKMTVTEIKPKPPLGKVGHAIKKPFRKLGRAIKGLFNN